MRTLLTVLLVCLFAAPLRAADIAPGGILILGDSNSEGPFGGALYDGLRATQDPATGQPLRVSIFAKCGAGANDWTSREYAKIDCGAWRCGDGMTLRACRHFMGGYIPPLSELYADLAAPRRVTLVVLGLNMIIGNRAQKLRDARRLIEAIQDNHSTCIWVGPPQPGDLFVPPAEFADFVADLRQTVARAGCRYIASDDKTDRRNLGIHTKDDHYAREDALAWAAKVLRELNRPASGGDKSLLELLREAPAAD